MDRKWQLSRFSILSPLQKLSLPLGVHGLPNSVKSSRIVGKSFHVNFLINSRDWKSSLGKNSKKKTSILTLNAALVISIWLCSIWYKSVGCVLLRVRQLIINVFKLLMIKVQRLDSDYFWHLCIIYLINY